MSRTCALAASLLALAPFWVPDAAWAASARYRLSIPAKPVSGALIDLAVQADVSLGGAALCRGRSLPLAGTYTLTEGLQRLLSGSNCTFQLVDARTVRVTRLPPPPAAPTPASSAPGPRAAVVDEPLPVSELVVTSLKRNVEFNRTPDAVSVIAGEQLGRTNAVDAGDISRQVAGFTMTNLGPARDKILLRGLSDGAFTGRTQSTVGSYLDNVPVTYNAPDPDLRLADVEAIEIVRGPQGALYGGGSLSGVYRIVTRKPEFGRFAASGSILAATTQSGSPSGEVEAMVNLPVWKDRAALRVVAYDEVQGGYVDDVNLRLSNVDRTNRVGGRAAFRVGLSDNWTATLSTTVQHLGSNDTQYVTPGAGRFGRANQVRETHKNDFSEAALNISGGGGWGRLESTTAAVRHAFSSRYDASMALTAFGDDQANVGVYDERAVVRIIVQDLVWTSPSAGRLRWLVGAFGLLSQEESPSTLLSRSSTGAPRLLYAEERTDHLSEVALYGEATYELSSLWSVSLGGRSFQTRLRVRSDVNAPAPGQSRAFDRQDGYDGFSPKVSIQRRVGRGLIYALASDGYRAGGFNSGGQYAPSTARRTFRPDHLRNYEVGTKLAFRDGRIRLRTSLFYDLWRDIQTDQYLSSGLSYTANVGDGRNLGLEGELLWRASDRLSVQLNGLVDRPKVTMVDPAFAAKVQGGLPGVPEQSFGALAIYERPIRPAMNVVLTGATGYVGKSRLTFDPALSPPMGGYFTAKLSAQLKTPRWTLAAFVTNPLNTAGDTFAYGNPFSFGQVRQVTPQRPRTISLSLASAF